MMVFLPNPALILPPYHTKKAAKCKRIKPICPEKRNGGEKSWKKALKSVQRFALRFVRYVKNEKDGRETLDKK